MLFINGTKPLTMSVSPMNKEPHYKLFDSIREKGPGRDSQQNYFVYIFAFLMFPPRSIIQKQAMF